MLISEIFKSIQGEGVNVGVVSLFIRVAGCNIGEKCPLPCDTKYAWDSKYKDEWKEMSVEEIVKIIKDSKVRNIIFTGGEPGLYADEIFKIINEFVAVSDVNKLLNNSYSFEIETNGYEKLRFLYPYFDIVTISPKIGFVNEKYLAEVKDLPNVYFKFVVRDKKDFEYWKSLVKKLKIDEKKVYMMPEGTTDEEIKKKAEWLVEECIKNNFNFSPRLQIWLWGNKRGR